MRALTWFLFAGLVLGLAACGFTLRANQTLPFSTIAVTPEHGGAVATELIRYLGDVVRPVAPPNGGVVPDVILDILQEDRQKKIVGYNTSGQVREYELHLNVRFKIRSARGEELVGPTLIAQFRNISFNESAVLSKETEEGLLYRDMQSDVVQQLMRRLVNLHYTVSTPPVTSVTPVSPASSATPQWPPA